MEGITEFEMMDSLISIQDDNLLAEGVEAVTMTLLSEGMDEDRILEFLESKVRTTFEDTLNYVKKQFGH